MWQTENIRAEKSENDVRPTNSLISLIIRTVWLESSLGAFR